MIKSFACKETEKIWLGFYSKKFPADLQARAWAKLNLIHSSLLLSDLKNPPSNNLEALKGDRNGQYSIRINSKWRVCFLWSNQAAYGVEIVDYH